MSEGDLDIFARFLTVNLLFYAGVVGLELVWLWLLRGSASFRRIRTTVAFSAAVGAAAGIFFGVRMGLLSADAPLAFRLGGLALTMLLGIAVLALLGLLSSTIYLGYRRLRPS